MARNIVKDYLSFEKKCLIEYIATITEKKLSSEICDIIANTYIDVRYYDMYEHVKKNIADNIDYYVIENVKKVFNEKNKEKNVPLVIEALIVLRYVYLYEKFHNDTKATKELAKYEKKLKNRYEDTKILVLDLVKLIKNNTHKKEKFLEDKKFSFFNN